jgi:hypothetical protein
MDEGAYIPMNNCKDGHLYIINARNADLGVYIEAQHCFRLRRNKFKLTYIDTEDHWDTGEPHGTVKPLKKLNYIGNMSDEKLMDKLNYYMKELYYSIKELKGFVVSSFVLIDSNTMKRLRAYNGIEKRQYGI